MPSITDTPKSETNPIAAEIQCEYPANYRVGDARERQKTVAQIIEQGVEQPDDQHQADRHNYLQAFLGLLEISEFSSPNQPISGRKLDVRCDSLLSLLDGAAQVAASHTELHRDETLNAFVINPRSSRIQGDGGQFAQRNVGIGAARGLIAHFNLADCLNAVAIFRRITDNQVDLPVALQNRCRNRSAHRRLNDRVHIARVKP